MGIVIIGGNECMVCRYEQICKKHGHEAKVFAKESGSFKRKVGNPGLMILFTNTVSHKMVNAALEVARKNNIPVERLHSSGASALNACLEAYCS